MLLFFDFSSGEIILILLVLFVVLGPQRLPEVARTLGKTINEMKRASAGFKNEINKEVQKIERESRYKEFLKEKEALTEKIESAIEETIADVQSDVSQTSDSNSQGKALRESAD